MKTIRRIKMITNDIFLYICYAIFLIGCAFGGYILFVSIYDFYIGNEMPSIKVNDTQQIEIVPKNGSDPNMKDYIYEVEDKEIASVDSEGNVTGLKKGKTNLKVKYKFSIFSKTFPIEVDDSDTGGEQKQAISDQIIEIEP